MHKHGSLVFHVTKDTYIGQVMSVDTINGTGYHAMCESAYSVAAAVKGALTSVPCVTKVSGTVPGKFDGATGTQNGLKLTDSAAPAASGLAGSVFMAAIEAAALNGYATPAVSAPAPAPAVAPGAAPYTTPAGSGASSGVSATVALLAAVALAVLF